MTKQRMFVPLVISAPAGVHFDYLTSEGHRASVSGIGSLDRWITQVASGEYTARQYGDPLDFDGALLIDKNPAVELCGERVVFDSPLVDLTLAEGQVDAFDRKSFLAQVFRKDCRNGFGTLVRAEAAARWVGPGPLDSVDLQTYARWWRARGARLGMVRQRPGRCHVEWEAPPPPIGVDTGTETPVLPELAAIGVNPLIPYCENCKRDGHLIGECPELDPEWLEGTERRGL